jgi:hypothetical protein
MEANSKRHSVTIQHSHTYEPLENLPSSLRWKSQQQRLSTPE